MYCSSRGSCRQAVAGKKGSTNRNRYHPPTSAAKETPTTHANNEAQSNSQPQRRLYSEIHHNDNPFFLQILPEEAKICKCCGNNFCHRQRIVPRDLVLEHKERYFFPIDGDWKKKTSVEQRGITLLSRGPSLYPAAISLFHERLH